MALVGHRCISNIYSHKDSQTKIYSNKEYQDSLVRMQLLQAEGDIQTTLILNLVKPLMISCFTKIKIIIWAVPDQLFTLITFSNNN